ncbi:MAG TPA: YdeI/OmpD-associated family protein [Candidatus Nanoarchaeia archaeon]|nr:YdeI/OmpD-associated family protein [Candidatus Nanoarchaeia archaeon]
MTHIYAGTRKEWRDWLKKNHLAENKVFLIKYKKHTGRPSLNNKEAMEEAICFGWIDTTVKRLDEERYQQCFMKRTDKSRWSKNTLRYAEEMIQLGKMTKHGLKRYQEGKLKPTIDLDLPKGHLPTELEVALKKGKAWDNFQKLAPSTRKVYVHWVARAKMPETKKKRVAIVVKQALAGKKLGE